jgi:hypothetical protein
MDIILRETNQIDKPYRWEGVKMSFIQLAKRLTTRKYDINTILTSRETEKNIAINQEFFHYGQFTR